MIVSFRDQATEDIFNGVNSRAARKSCPQELWAFAARRLDQLDVPMNTSQRALANAIHVPYPRVNELVNQERGIMPSTALRLANFFGVSADFWPSLQVRWDLFRAQASEAEELKSIEDFHRLQKIA